MSLSSVYQSDFIFIEKSVKIVGTECRAISGRSGGDVTCPCIFRWIFLQVRGSGSFDPAADIPAVSGHEEFSYLRFLRILFNLMTSVGAKGGKGWKILGARTANSDTLRGSLRFEATDCRESRDKRSSPEGSGDSFVERPTGSQIHRRMSSTFFGRFSSSD